jgi:hypothetical protein
MGFRIFRHAVKLVFSQLGDALRVSGLLYLVTIVLFGVAFYFAVQSVMAGGSPDALWQLNVAGLVSAVFYLWIAVGWHRFVLLDEPIRSPAPPFRGDRMLAYFGRLLQTMLIAFVLVVAVMIPSALLANAAAGTATTIIAALPPLIAFVAMFVFGYRLAPMFPAAAVGRPVGMREAWASTRGATGTLFLLAIISVIGSILIDLPGLALLQLPQGPYLNLAWALVATWVKLMVGISILTAIYGVYVEKRAIA